ncbi:MAG TPA: carboxypeptidase-like regulatory domain-containing protein, partial [Candidatus Paceibacterota bacterium]
IRALLSKFPSLSETFIKLGVTSSTDLARLSSAKLSFPTLANLSSVPTNVIFARSGEKLLDFNSTLSISNKGDVEQSITTISGFPLNLSVKPDAPVKSITGYLVLKESRFGRAGSPQAGENRFSLPLSSQLSSLITAYTDLTQEAPSPPVLPYTDTFAFTDPDGDGLYTAGISAPGTASTYQIVTVLDYQNNEKKELRLTLVVDPEGYIYQKQGENEVRITGATVTIYMKDDPSTSLDPARDKPLGAGSWRIWNASDFSQTNPQTTDKSGEYSFLVPPGTYRLGVTHPDYPSYDSGAFVVTESEGVHMNVELKASRSWWDYAADNRVLLGAIILLIILLGFHIFRERRVY